ncbi:YceI family protein [Sorangium sp. So ce1014]|uniref:YceI family protein n=1 Tax=Sorangium sp. So ce1014 TaxID=3133326 RepID=UPI003F643767
MITSRIARLVLPAALALSLAGCEDPTKDKPKATVSAAAPAQAQAAAPTGPAEALPLDAAASTIGFVGSKVTGKHEGKFEKISGSITLAGGKAEGGKLSIEADTASVKSDAEKLDGHLKSPDFFDVEKFPKATFTSSQIKAGGENGATHTITGELDLHGVKKTITFPATIAEGADAVSGNAEFVINRKDFGIVYPGKQDDLIRDDVLLKLSLKAPRKQG